MFATRSPVRKPRPFPLMAVLTLAIGHAVTIAAHADTVSLSETQKDEVKCVTTKEDGETFKDCWQVTTGSYTATAKLSEDTFDEYDIHLADIDEETPLGITIGAYDFSGTLSTADSSQLSLTKLSGIWTQSHEVCSKYDQQAEECIKYKPVVHETVKVNATAHGGTTITISGKLDAEGNGLQIYAQTCLANEGETFSEEASISIGDTVISNPLQITCKIKTSTKDPEGTNGGPFELNNMTIKAKKAAKTTD